MKKSILLCISAIVMFLCSCKTVQVYETTPTANIVERNNKFVFENDTVKIIYSFWEDRGVLSYTLYNKLSIPIYIDWKKCSFIKNGEKLDYWVDEVNSKSVSKSKSNLYSAYYFSADATTKTVTNTNAVKPERVIFIAPNSSIKRQQFVLYPYAYQSLEKVKSISYTAETTPLIFRNFISISTTENFEKEYYVDNGFYVSNRLEISKGKFSAGIKYINPKYFYIKQ